MAVTQQVTRDLSTSPFVVGSHRCDPRDVGVLLEDHGWHLEAGLALEEILALTLGALQREEHAGDALLLSQRRDDLIRRFRRRDQHRHDVVSLPCGLHHPRQERGVRGVLQREMTLILDEEAEHVTLPEPERAGQCVTLVTELADRFLDPQPRLRTRHRTVVDHVGDRLHREAGPLRDVSDRGAPSLLAGHRVHPSPAAGCWHPDVDRDACRLLASAIRT